MEETTATPVSETQNDVETPQGETPTTTTQTDETPESTTSTTPDSATQKELERLQASLKRANAEAKENRLAKEELKRLKDELEASKLSETERLQKQYDDLKTQHEEYTQAQTERMIKNEVALEAAKLGVDPNVLDKVARFLDWEEIEVDEEGKPTNVRALVEQLVKDIPGLRPEKRSAPTSGGATNPPRSTTAAPKELSWDVIGKLTADEYKANASRIQKWMAEHSRR
jgi:phage-related minor tail protein